MFDVRKWKDSRVATAAGAAILVALGAAGGAGAVKATRPAVEMAPTVRTPIARLANSSGVVTVKGRVAEVYGDRFVVQDESGRTMVAAGRDAQGTVASGQPVTVQGRFDDGQLRASYLIDGAGAVTTVGRGGHGPGGKHGERDRDGDHGRDRDGDREGDRDRDRDDGCATTPAAPAAAVPAATAPAAAPAPAAAR